MSKLSVYITFLAVLCVNEGAKILGVFPNSGYSQYILGSALMKKLAARGHDVTMISPFTQKTAIPNFLEVQTDFRMDEDLNLYDLETLDIFTNIMILQALLGLPLTEDTLKSKNVQQLLNSDATFDLVICEIFVNEAHMGFAHHYKAPLILFSSLGASEWSNPLVGNPGPFSHLPITFSGYNDRMDFWQRLRNSVAGIFDLVYKHLVTYPKQDEILKKYFPGAPHLGDLIYNASLMLLNSNVAMNTPLAHVPNMIEIGGFHVNPKPLAKDFQEFLDDATDGAIFFSMGSNLRSSDLPQDKKDGILRVFSKLKQRVLWKWEDENLPGKPANVRAEKWLPQQDILAHPNMRAFISHCGLLSTTETVYNGVPIICIPIFGDQKMNTETAVANGYAIKLPFPELNEENLSWALNEMLTNTSYIETARRRSRILKDQPLKPMDNAMFWIEYVLRHRGAPHLRSAGLNLTWYQYFLLDVVGFIAAVIFSCILICKMIFKVICPSNKTKKSIKQKKS